jgi:decaprenyl-phosphate phosphoribosyltransferase
VGPHGIRPPLTNWGADRRVPWGHSSEGADVSAARSFLVALRPRQWAKNLLVVVAPLGAGRLFEAPVLLATALAFLAFCLVSSATYLVNDVIDRERDSTHPVKSARPVASGALSPRAAITGAVLLGIAGLAVAFATSLPLGWVAIAYVAVTLAYSLFLKHAPVLELALLALGFLLRAVAGGAASDIPLSEWFLLVAGFGSLFMAAGKRYSELMRVHDLVGVHDDAPSPAGMRRSLAGYTPTYLRFVWTVAAGITVTTYCLWAVEVGGGNSIPWAMLSIIPFALGILRYALDVDAGRGETPEETVLGDYVLVILGAAWFVLFGLGALGVGT